MHSSYPPGCDGPPESDGTIMKLDAWCENGHHAIVEAWLFPNDEIQMRYEDETCELCGTKRTLIEPEG